MPDISVPILPNKISSVIKLYPKATPIAFDNTQPIVRGNTNLMSMTQNIISISANLNWIGPNENGPNNKDRATYIDAIRA